MSVATVTNTNVAIISFNASVLSSQMMITAAASGTTGPPGATNGASPSAILLALRRSTPRQQIM